MASDVQVVINLAKATTGVGFGYPLIFQGAAASAIPYTVCENIQDVINTVGGITSTDTAEQIATKTAAAMQTKIYKAALLMLMQNTAPSQFAIMASTSNAVTALPDVMYQPWRQLIVVSLGDTTGSGDSAVSESTAAQISAYIEEQSDSYKMYFTSVSAASALSISNAERTVVLCHAEPTGSTVVIPEAALVGATAGLPAGSFTYKNMILNGLTPAVLTDAQLTAIENGHAMAFVLKAGEGVTSDGKTTSGEYIDIVDSKDWIIQNIVYETQRVLNENNKIPYDNNGIAMLENVCVNVLRDAANNGMIAVNDNGDYQYSVSYAPRSQTSATDRANRAYVEGAFSFALAGAIHTVEITGTIEI